MSRFVPSGAISASSKAEDKPPEEFKTSTANPEWERVQKELEADRAKRSEARRKAVEGDEKSLYDVLQANKAAKEAAFEEANKLRHQFKALDDDDVEFLDEVRQKRKEEEEKLRRETEERLKVFRERQKGGEDGKEAQEKDNEVEGGVLETWGVGRKRKRNREKEGGVKGVRRRVSEGRDDDEKKGVEKSVVQGEEEIPKEDKNKPESIAKKPAKGLVAYDSDDSD